jgi:hypothetical protein
MMKKALFDDIGWFDENLRCCEDYDLWLRVSSSMSFLLIDEPLTIKEGGREDQLSHIHRLGMDEKRIYSIRKLLDSAILSEAQRTKAFAELTRKIRIFAAGCLKHGKLEQGHNLLNILEAYR